MCKKSTVDYLQESSIMKICSGNNVCQFISVLKSLVEISEDKNVQFD